jgi:crotonobetainyl-CoA:carnitine CoA-transferase CaiB-like acyl-CoA transferase
MIPRMAFEPQATASLCGLRVLDLSRLVAGNMVSLQLADQGAEVIKVEDPMKGDPLRAWREDGISFFWKVYARNKKSLALDLRHPEGRALLGELAATSHVLVENYRPGTLERMGLAPATLQERNSRLVILRISGFGQTGPYRDRPGFGTLIEAMSGFAAKNGHADRPPALPPTALADMIAGLYRTPRSIAPPGASRSAPEAARSPPPRATRSQRKMAVSSPSPPRSRPMPSDCSAPSAAPT